VDGQLALPGSPVTAEVGQTINFDGSASQSGSSPIASYEWNFGDGNAGTGAAVSHAYGQEGGFEVTLTAIDENGLPNTEVIGIQIVAAGQ
jgi:serine protease